MPSSDPHAVLRSLHAAADRACDHWQDDDSARQEMRRQIAEVQPEHYAGLLEHFDAAYPAGGES